MTCPVFRRILLATMSIVGAMTFSHELLAARVVDDSPTVQIRGNLAPQLTGAADVGAASKDLPLDRVVLLLNLRAGASERLERLLEDQLDPTSPRYHQWLTPEEFGSEFGITDEDLKAVVDWLQRNGLGVDEVAVGRRWISFSGTVEQVERAFHTEFRNLIVDGEMHRAARWEPEVPVALVDLVAGFPSLGDFFATSQQSEREPLTNLASGAHAMAPGDFSTIYNTTPLYGAGIDGTGQTIAVVGRSDLKLADVQSFRSRFGLPANDPVVTHNGVPPGIGTSLEESEACLDVEWSGAVAPRATVNFVVTKSTATSGGDFLSAQYIVNNNLAPILTMSFFQCEDKMSPSSLATFDAMWQQAAAQGITVFVCSGDSGAAGCDAYDATAGTVRGVSGVSSTSYNVCVGGTQFMDTADPSLYWNSANSSNLTSAKSYIPEQAWNESGSVTGGAGLWSTGGGPSKVYYKPTWQAAPGVPTDGFRDTPDVSLSAAAHDGYIVFREYDPTKGLFYVQSGTSASTPSLAGIMALVVQKTGSRQGNANPIFYRLAQAQYSGGGPAVFHDVTTGNNTVPGVTGFSAGPGYDLTTGLGSVDAAALVNNFAASSSPVANFTWSPNPAVVGQPVQFTDTSTGSPTGWTWSLGDSTGSSLQNPIHTYAGSGPYAVTLTASNASGASTKAQTVTFAPSGTAPVANFTWSPNPAVAGQPVQFTDTSTGSPTGWTWSLGDNSGSSLRNPTHTYAGSGPYAVTLTASNASGASTKALAVTFTAPASGNVVKTIPIILDVAGKGGVRFSTELTLGNRGTSSAALQVAYTPATSLGASGGGIVPESLAAGRQLVIPDAIAYLRSKGLTIPTGSNQGGTLQISFSGLSSPDVAFAGARTTAPAGGGSAGLSYPAVRQDEGLAGDAYLYGLRETPTDRSNLALVNLNTSSSVALRVTLFSGAGGASQVLPDVILSAGQWSQLGSVLSSAGFTSGYAKVQIVSGTGPYFAYAVFNDNATNDGSFVSPVVGIPAKERQTLPVLVESATFQSELVLSNPSAQPLTATLSYVESLTPSFGVGGAVAESLQAFEQKIIPNAIDYLRKKGVSIGASGQATFAGALSATFTSLGAPAWGFVGARTASQGDGGEYGLFYRALSVSEAASTDTWIFGLQQNATTRSNVALVNLGDTGTSITVRFDVFDGDTRSFVGSTAPSILSPGAWTQFSAFLPGFGVSNGYVHAVRTSGTSHFVAYGVLNDGATSSSGRTNDGSYVASANR
jgi:pseudomonalisin